MRQWVHLDVYDLLCGMTWDIISPIVGLHVQAFRVCASPLPP